MALGDKYTSRNRLAQALMAQEQSAGPIQSHTQGLAHLLRQGLIGYNEQADNADRQAAMQGMNQGMAAKGWINPDDPQGGVVNSAGGLEGMIASQQALGGNEYAQRNLQGLLMQKMGQDQAAAAAKLARQQGKEDYLYKQQNKAFKPETTKPTPRKIIKGADGFNYYADDRTRVLPEAELRDRQTMYDPDLELKKAKFSGTGKRYEAANTSIDEADGILSDVSQMAALVNRVDSGSFAETKLTLQKTMQAMGMDVDLSGIANAEAMKAKGMDFVMKRIAQTKGAISEKEMAAFAKASPGIMNTPEGNRRILALVKNVTDRMKAEAEAVREAYGNNPDISVKELDDVKFAARKAFGTVVPDFGPVSPNAAQPTGGAVQINDDAGYNALPSGQLFIDPEGNVRKKP